MPLLQVPFDSDQAIYKFFNNDAELADRKEGLRVHLRTITKGMVNLHKYVKKVLTELMREEYLSWKAYGREG